MTAFSTLRTRLQARCGITVSSLAETDLLNEALNAAITKAAYSGAPELRQAFSGYTLAALSTTVSSHTAANTYLVLASTSGVYPGDVLNDTANAKSYVIRSVGLQAANAVDVGIPITPSISGNSVTVTRRSLVLPTPGLVIEIKEVGAREPLRLDALSAAYLSFETGTARLYTQQFAEANAVSYISLFPAPSSPTQFVITQIRAVAEDGDVYMSEALLHYVLAEAYKFRLLMGGGVNGAVMLAEEFKALRSFNAGGHGIVSK